MAQSPFKSAIKVKHDETCETKGSHQREQKTPYSSRQLQFQSGGYSMFSSNKKDEIKDFFQPNLGLDLETFAILQLDDEDDDLNQPLQNLPVLRQHQQIPQTQACDKLSWRNNRQGERSAYDQVSNHLIQKENEHAQIWQKWAQDKISEKKQKKIFYQSDYKHDRNQPQYQIQQKEIPNIENDKIKFKSAFKLFKLDKIVNVKQEHPEMDFKARLSYLKEAWKQLNTDEKYLYVQRSRLEKEKAMILQKEEQIVSQIRQKQLKQ